MVNFCQRLNRVDTCVFVCTLPCTSLLPTIDCRGIAGDLSGCGQVSDTTHQFGGGAEGSFCMFVPPVLRLLLRSGARGGPRWSAVRQWRGGAGLNPVSLLELSSGSLVSCSCRQTSSVLLLCRRPGEELLLFSSGTPITERPAPPDRIRVGGWGVQRRGVQ